MLSFVGIYLLNVSSFIYNSTITTFFKWTKKCLKQLGQVLINEKNISLIDIAPTSVSDYGTS